MNKTKCKTHAHTQEHKSFTAFKFGPKNSIHLKSISAYNLSNVLWQYLTFLILTWFDVVVVVASLRAIVPAGSTHFDGRLANMMPTRTAQHTSEVHRLD